MTKCVFMSPTDGFCLYNFLMKDTTDFISSLQLLSNDNKRSLWGHISRVFSTNSVPHPSTIPIGQCLTSATEVSWWITSCQGYLKGHIEIAYLYTILVSHEIETMIA